MRNRMVSAGLTVAAVIVLCVVASAAFAQRGGGQRGTMRSMIYLERSWTGGAFQLNCSRDQVGQVRPTYRNTLKARDAALKQAAASQDREAMMKAMTDAKTRLETKLKSVLSDAQWKKLEQLMTMRTGGRRGGQGGG